MHQLAMMGLLPSPATQSLGAWHSAWPLLLLAIVVIGVLPIAHALGKNGGRPPDHGPPKA